MATASMQKDEYVSLWSLCKGNGRLASRALNFLCKDNFGLVRIFKDDFEQLELLYQQDADLRYRWGVGSPHVKEIATRLQVLRRSTAALLKAHNFNARETTKPSKEERDEWIDHRWKVVERESVSSLKGEKQEAL